MAWTIITLKNDEYTHLREKKSLYGNNYEDDIKKKKLKSKIER
jgi:hypothetical protein